jgi:glycosyltransferase involved in cell wall biosynthesis
MPKTISLCIIARDEADNLKRCIKSYRELVDEIIVIDTGSTDNSIHVAEQFGAKVSCLPWKGDFSHSRNASLDKASSDWILWTDADDIITEENCEKIGKIKDGYDLNCCFSFMIKNSMDGILGSVFNQIRMFPRDLRIRFRYKVHEQVLPSIEEVGYKTHFTDIMVLHTGYSDPEIVKRKQMRNMEILKGQLKENEDNPVTVYLYAGNLFDLDRFEEAIPYYEKAMQLSGEQKSKMHIYEGSPVALADVYERIKDYDNARKWAEKAYKINPNHPQTNFIIGKLDEIECNVDDAIKHFEFVLSCEEKPTFTPVDVNMLKINACSHLSQQYMKKGQMDKVVEILDQAMEIRLGRRPEPSDKGDMYFQSEDYLKAGQEYLVAVNDEKSNDWHSFTGLAKVFIINNSPQDAIDTLTLGIERFPENEEIKTLLADLYCDLRLNDKADNLYEEILETSNDDM